MVLSSKFKIILIVFAVIVGLYVLQFIVTGVTNSSKREAFENDDFDDEPNEKPKKHNKKKHDDDEDDKSSKGKRKWKETFDVDTNEKDTEKNSKDKGKPPVAVSDKEVKLDVLEKVESVFSNLYPESDKKPVIFDMLTRKEHFEELKEKYESGEGIDKYIKNFVKKTMSELETEKIDAPAKAETFEEAMDKPFNHIMDSLDKADSKSKLMAELDEVVTKIERIQNELKKIQDDEPKKKSTAPTPIQDKKKEKIIEGFENRFNYASY